MNVLDSTNFAFFRLGLAQGYLGKVLVITTDFSLEIFSISITFAALLLGFLHGKHSGSF